MIKLLTLLTLLTLTLPGRTQTANFFADGSRWVYWTWENSEPGQQTAANSTEQNIIHGDTIIGGITYFKLYTTRHNELHIFLPPVTQIIHSYDSTGPVFIRYDTLLRQVFYLPAIDSTERLIYDFTLQAGDTIPMQSPDFPNAIIGSIDTITVFGVRARRFSVDIGPSGDHLNFIIEGIGGSNGLTYFRPAFGSVSGGTVTTHFICFQYGDTFISDQSECPFIDFVSADDTPEKQPSLTIAPNPSNDVFIITIDPALLNATFILADGAGRIAQNTKLTQISTEVHPLVPGIYFWSIVHEGSLIKAGKVVIQ